MFSYPQELLKGLSCCPCPHLFSPPNPTNRAGIVDSKWLPCLKSRPDSQPPGKFSGLIPLFLSFGQTTQVSVSCVFPALGLYFCCPLVLVWQYDYNKTPWSEVLGRTFLAILEAEISRSRCQQGWFLLRPRVLACRRPSSLWVFTLSSLCACLQPNLFFQGHQSWRGRAYSNDLILT